MNAKQRRTNRRAQSEVQKALPSLRFVTMIGSWPPTPKFVKKTIKDSSAEGTVGVVLWSKRVRR